MYPPALVHLVTALGGTVTDTTYVTAMRSRKSLAALEYKQWIRHYAALHHCIMTSLISPYLITIRLLTIQCLYIPIVCVSLLRIPGGNPYPYLRAIVD